MGRIAAVCPPKQRCFGGIPGREEARACRSLVSTSGLQALGRQSPEPPSSWDMLGTQGKGISRGHRSCCDSGRVGVTPALQSK